MGAARSHEVALLRQRAEPVLAGAAVSPIDDPHAASSRLCLDYSAHRLTLLGSPADFRMQLRLRPMGPLALASLRFNTEVELAQEPSGKYFLVTTQLRGTSEIHTDKETLRGGPGMVVVDSATSGVVKRFSADSERLHVRIERDALTALCAQLLGRSLERPLEFRPVMPPGSAAHRRWLCMARLLLDYADDPPAAPFASRIHGQIQEMAMLMLLTDHRHSYSDSPDGSAPTVAPRHVKAAEAYMRAHAALPLTLADIAGAAGVSIRTLTAGFQACRQTTPMRHLRDIRLAAARDELLAGAGSVAEVALRWGFGNLGRFAADYRLRYGEYPSDTLRH